MKTILLGPSKEILQQAASSCGLEETPSECLNLVFADEIARPVVCALEVSDWNARTFPRQPKKAFVANFGAGLAVCWDDHRGGFGLETFVGRFGEKLKLAYAFAAVRATLRDRNVQFSGLIAHNIRFQAEVEMASIIVTIDNVGNTRIKVEGQRGPACVDLTAALEAALGGVVAEEKTADYYQASEVSDRVRQT
jgi:hypothetical protein